jgi:hypothetical protein
MANIKLKDLVNSTDNSSFIRDLSEDELELQGGWVWIAARVVIAAVALLYPEEAH